MRDPNDPFGFDAQIRRGENEKIVAMAMKTIGVMEAKARQDVEDAKNPATEVGVAQMIIEVAKRFPDFNWKFCQYTDYDHNVTETGMRITVSFGVEFKK